MVWWPLMLRSARMGGVHGVLVPGHTALATSLRSPRKQTGRRWVVSAPVRGRPGLGLWERGALLWGRRSSWEGCGRGSPGGLWGRRLLWKLWGRGILGCSEGRGLLWWLRVEEHSCGAYGGEGSPRGGCEAKGILGELSGAPCGVCRGKGLKLSLVECRPWKPPLGRGTNSTCLSFMRGIKNNDEGI